MADKTAYSVVIVPNAEEDGGGFTALVPELHGCMADGETREEAVTEIASAILEWIDEAKALGRDIPAPGELAKDVRTAAREHHEATQRVIAQQDELIKTLRNALDEATNEIEALSAQSQVRFGWDLTCLEVHVPQKRSLVTVGSH